MFDLNGHHRATGRPVHLRFLIFDFRSGQRFCASESQWQNSVVGRKMVTPSHGPSSGLTPSPPGAPLAAPKPLHPPSTLRSNTAEDGWAKAGVQHHLPSGGHVADGAAIASRSVYPSVFRRMQAHQGGKSITPKRAKNPHLIG
jgi:hypothetical protein